MPPSGGAVEDAGSASLPWPALPPFPYARFDGPKVHDPRPRAAGTRVVLRLPIRQGKSSF